MTKQRLLPISALLIGLSIIIPTFMVKIVIPPASFTLASHVPIFIAMFISPQVSIAVAIGSSLGFFLTTTPEIALRALSHIVFAYFGSKYLLKNMSILNNPKKTLAFNVVIGLIHAIIEVAVVVIFYILIGVNMFDGHYINLLILILFGGFIHSLIDFYISVVIVKRIPQINTK